MESYYTLADELISRNIEFVDGFGNITFMYKHKEIYSGVGDITNWIEFKMKKLDRNNKYYKLSDISDGYFIGDMGDGLYKNMMAEVFKLTYSYGFMNSLSKDYIIIIVDNPLYDDETNYDKGRYKLLIYSVVRHGAYKIDLKFVDIFTSTI